MPAILWPPASRWFVFCLAHDPAEGHKGAFDQLDARFASVPASAYNAGQHVGTRAESFSS
ncbi:hypothetical protein [Streptomyces sp. NPDC003032]